MKQLLVAVGIGALVMIGVGILVRVVNNGAPPAVVIESTPAPAESSSTPTLNGTSWNVVAINGENVEDAGMTVSFQNGKVTGTDGCNRYSTGYIASDDALTIQDQMAGTLMACPEETMVLADLFRSTLITVASFQVADDSLILLDSEFNKILELSAVSTNLSGTSWDVTGYNNGNQALVGVTTNTNLLLNFVDDTQIAGNAGCNSFSGTYTAQDSTIAIGPLASTMMYCVEPEGIMEQESQFLRALENSTVSEFEASSLVLRDDAGAMQVTATRK